MHGTKLYVLLGSVNFLIVWKRLCVMQRPAAGALTLGGV